MPGWHHLIIDVSHVHESTIADVVELVQQRALSGHLVPVIANHTVCEAVAIVHQAGSQSRGLADELIIKIAETGGVIGIVPLNYFIVGNLNREEFIDEYIEHIIHVVDLVGVDHVGLSSDSYVNGYPHHGRVVTADGTVLIADKTSIWTLGSDLNEPDRWKQVIRSLSEITDDSGEFRFSIDDLQKIAGSNFIRVFRQALPGYGQPEIRVVDRQRINGTTEFYFDWESVHVNESPNFQFPHPQYEIFIQGKTDSGVLSRFPGSVFTPETLENHFQILG